MGNFNANNAYAIATETELATALSHFSSEVVLSIVEEAMKKRFEEMPILSLPNVVAALEANFKAIMIKYSDLPETAVEVPRVRNETYVEIITSICREFGLVFTEDDNIDLYSAAHIMYDFFVCNFMPTMVSFFSNYVYYERNSLYESLNLAEFKKSKDSSTVYGKKVFKDVKLAVINANIDYVVSQISGFDIPLQQIVNITRQPYDAAYINSLVNPSNDFYKMAYVSLLNSHLRANIITSIKFKLIEYAQFDG